MADTVRAPQTPQPIKRGTTNIIDLRGLHDETAIGTVDEFPDDGVVTMTLKDPAGADVVGAVGIGMTFVPSKSRYETVYRGVIPASLALPGSKYFAHVTAVANGATVGFKITCPVVD